MSDQTEDLPEHVRRNRAAWDRLAAEYVEPGERNWATDQPSWATGTGSASCGAAGSRCSTWSRFGRRRRRPPVTRSWPRSTGRGDGRATRSGRRAESDHEWLCIRPVRGVSGAERPDRPVHGRISRLRPDCDALHAGGRHRQPAGLDPPGGRAGHGQRIRRPDRHAGRPTGPRHGRPGPVRGGARCRWRGSARDADPQAGGPRTTRLAALPGDRPGPCPAGQPPHRRAAQRRGPLPGDDRCHDHLRRAARARAPRGGGRRAAGACPSAAGQRRRAARSAVGRRPRPQTAESWLPKPDE